MMKHFHIRSFHASHRLNLMDNEREYLPWMSDLPVIARALIIIGACEPMLTMTLDRFGLGRGVLASEHRASEIGRVASVLEFWRLLESPNAKCGYVCSNTVYDCRNEIKVYSNAVLISYLATRSSFNCACGLLRSPPIHQVPAPGQGSATGYCRTKLELHADPHRRHPHSI